MAIAIAIAMVIATTPKANAVFGFTNWPAAQLPEVGKLASYPEVAKVPMGGHVEQVVRDLLPLGLGVEAFPLILF